MIRVLHVLGRLDRGGTESMLMNHYRHINRSRFQFDFVVHTEDHCDFDDEVLRLGGRIFHVPRFTVLNYCAYRRAWRRLLGQHPECMVIHVHHFLVAGIVLPIAEEHGVKVRIAHSHNTRPPIFLLKEKVMWLFHRGMIQSSTRRLACSEAAGRYLFGRNPYELFRNAIETSRFRYDEGGRKQKRRELGIADDELLIGHVGSFRTRQKNHSFLVDVFAEVVRRQPQARLLMVGDGDLMPEIRSKVESLGIVDRCVFAGVRSDVPALLSAMDVFLFPSFFEGLSVVSVEVQAAGLPCVASTAITSESRLTDLFVQLSLDRSVDEWATAVLSAGPGKARSAYSDDVAHSGYDVAENVKRLERIYQEA